MDKFFKKIQSDIRFRIMRTCRIHRMAVLFVLPAIPYGLANAEEYENAERVALPPMTVKSSVSEETTGYVPKFGTTATKTDTPLIETPQSISVITRDQLDIRNAQSVSQALRYSAGLVAEPYGTETRFDWFFIRGFDQSNTSLYRDGLRQQFNLGVRNETYGLERIEIMRGPTSVLYGQNAPGGLVNLITKKPLGEPLREIELQGGSFDNKRIALDFSGPFDTAGKYLYRLTGLAKESETQVDHTKDNRLFIAPAFTWRPSQDTTLTVLANYQKDDTNYSQFLPAQGTFLSNPNGKIPLDQFVSEPGFDDVNRTQYSVGYLFEHHLDQTWTLTQNFRYGFIDYRPRTVYGANLEADLRTLDRFPYIDDRETDVITLDNRAQAHWQIGDFDQTALIGVDFISMSQRREAQFGDNLPIDLFNPVFGQPITGLFTFNNTRQDLDQIGLYAQSQLRYAEHWVVLFGLRHDWTDTETDDFRRNSKSRQHDEAFTYRAGLLRLFDNGLAPYFSYAQSFNPVAGTDIDGNPFSPTRGEQYEFGLKYQPPGWNSLVTLALFHLTQTNVPTPDPTNPVNQVQNGKVRSRGVELELTTSPIEGLNLTAAYSYLEPEITRSNIPGQQGTKPFGVPDHTGSFWADYTLQQGSLTGLGAGVGVRYIGNTESNDAFLLDTDGNPVNTRVKLPSYTLVDAAIHYNWNEMWRISLTGTNLGDRRYVVPISNTGFNYGLARTFLATLRFRW